MIVSHHDNRKTQAMDEDKILLALTLLAAILFIINAGISATGGATEGVVIQNETESGQISDTHPTFITPVGWTFMVWNIIFVYLGAALIYLAWTRRRKIKTTSGQVESNPAVFSKGVAILFIFNQLLYTAWLYVWDNDLMTASAAILVAVSIMNWVIFVLLSRNLRKATPYFKTSKVVWYHRLLVQNSFGMFTAWTTLASLLNESIAVIYEAHLSDQTVSLVSLGILTAIVVGYFVVDICCLDASVRYVITPYLTLIWELTGTEVNLAAASANSTAAKEKEPVMYFVTALMVLLGLFTVVKISTMVCRHVTARPSESSSV